MSLLTDQEYYELRSKLPAKFEEFRHEEICEMIFDKNHGFLVCRLTDEAKKEFLASPRAFMIEMLKKERNNSARCLEILESKHE